MLHLQEPYFRKVKSGPLRNLLYGILVLIVAAVVLQVASHAQQAAGVPQILDSEDLVIVTAGGSHTLKVEIADEPHEQAKGLMFREDLAANEGMLFDFGETRMVTMWMKNTPLSLDMLFVRSDGTVATIAERTEPFSLKTISSGEPVSFVLELRGGVAKLMGIKPGDRLEHRLFDS